MLNRRDEFLEEYYQILATDKSLDGVDEVLGIKHETSPLATPPIKKFNSEFPDKFYDVMTDEMKAQYARSTYLFGTWSSADCWKTSAKNTVNSIGSFFYRPSPTLNFSCMLVKEPKTKELVNNILNEIIERALTEAETKKTEVSKPSLTL